MKVLKLIKREFRIKSIITKKSNQFRSLIGSIVLLAFLTENVLAGSKLDIPKLLSKHISRSLLRPDPLRKEVTNVQRRLVNSEASARGFKTPFLKENLSIPRKQTFTRPDNWQQNVGIATALFGGSIAAYSLFKDKSEWPLIDYRSESKEEYEFQNTHYFSDISYIEEKLKFSAISGGWKRDFIGEDASFVTRRNFENLLYVRDHNSGGSNRSRVSGRSVDELISYLQGVIELARTKLDRFSKADDPIACKEFYLDLLNNEGSIINLEEFDETGAFVRLRTLTEFQSNSLDEQLKNRFLSHRKHAQSRILDSGNSIPRVLIQGAGPNGLFLALKLFLAGADVHVVNDREENGSRKQILRLDPKMTAELSYLLGSTFDKVFRGKDSSEKKLVPVPTDKNTPEARFGNLSGDIFVDTTVRHLEDVLRQRLIELAGAKSDQVGRYVGTGLKLSYRVKLDEILPPSSNDGDLRARLSQDNSTVELSEQGYDLVVLSGGANDRTRNKYLSPAVKLLDDGIFSVSVFNKRLSSNYREDFFRTGGNPALDVKYWEAARFIANNLKHSEIENLIQSAEELSSSFKTKYANIGLQFANSIKSNFQARTFENSRVLYFGVRLNPFIQDLKRDFDKELDGKSFATKNVIDKIKETIEKELVLSQMSFFLRNGAPVVELEHDNNKVNHSIFKVEQSAALVPAVKLQSGAGKSMILVSFGEALLHRIEAGLEKI